ncbi:hypothetical protein AURDEDRAFT_159090 [Auricularia subglabra TFB-10046 SS5]|nr:hypothetical protein AURDEDRAFT_159090 [Auricularia subglabra TFB-10046 SS5]
MTEGIVPRLIFGRKVGVKHGVEVARLEPRAVVVFTRGARGEADVLVFGISNQHMRDTVRRVFCAEIIDKTTRVCGPGLDDKGEIRGMSRRSDTCKLRLVTCRNHGIRRLHASS